MTGALSQRLNIFWRVHIGSVTQVGADPGMHLFGMRRLPLAAAQIGCASQDLLAHLGVSRRPAADDQQVAVELVDDVCALPDGDLFKALKVTV